MPKLKDCGTKYERTCQYFARISKEGERLGAAVCRRRFDCAIKCGQDEADLRAIKNDGGVGDDGKEHPERARKKAANQTTRITLEALLMELKKALVRNNNQEQWADVKGAVIRFKESHQTKAAKRHMLDTIKDAVSIPVYAAAVDKAEATVQRDEAEKHAED